jgi:murein DD-endopeptidase MepM/ murein hydrolase activator NlpD
VTYYGHCSSLAVSVGDVVQQGDVIAYMGATGVASGVHVHFEYRPLGGDPIDPLLVLPER